MPYITAVNADSGLSMEHELLSFNGEDLIEAAETAIAHPYPHQAYNNLHMMLLEMQSNAVRFNELLSFNDFNPQTVLTDLLASIADQCSDANNLFDEQEYLTFAEVAMLVRNRVVQAQAEGAAPDVLMEQPSDADSSDDGGDVEMWVEDDGEIWENPDEEMESDEDEEMGSNPDEDMDSENGELNEDPEDPPNEDEDPDYILGEVISRLRAALYIRELSVVDVAEIDPADRQCPICMEAFYAGSEDQPVRLPCPGRHVIGQNCLLRSLSETGTRCPFDRVDVVQLAKDEGWF